MPTYTFDVKLFVTVDVEAASEAEARKMVSSREFVITRDMDTATFDGADLIEIDGEAV